MRKIRAPPAGSVALAALAALAAVAWATSAAPQAPTPAAPDKEACASAHEQAQISRKHGRLLEARGKLQLCAADACPALARQDCGVWLVEVEERLPTIVIAAKDTHGAPTTAVKCALDGEPLIDQLGAAPLPINPGAHTLKCEMEGAPPVEQALAVVEGEKGRRVDLTFEPPKQPDPPPVPSASTSASTSASVAPPPFPPPPPPRATPAIVYGLAGVAVVGLASFVYFGVRGLSDESGLRGSCKPLCNPSDVSAISTKYHIADTSLAISVLAAGAAAWIYFSNSATPGAPQTGARVGVTAMPGGGGARVELSF
jgi:hypothetical protein